PPSLLKLLPTKDSLPAIDDTVQQSRWSGGTHLQVGFSQLSLTNWAAGGNNSIALNGRLNIYRNCEISDEMFWENRLQLGYGFIQAFGEHFKKSDDQIILDSKWGYKAIKNLFASALFNFRSQMTNGYSYPSGSDPILISGPFAPAYFSLGVGMDWKPIKQFSLNFSPLTGNLVVIANEELRTKYGNRVDQLAKLELGAQLKLDYQHQISKRLTINSALNLFSDYLNNPQRIKVYWDLFLDSKINRYFSFNIKTNLIYDHNILIENSEGVAAPRVQFKEMLSVGFSYTFGNFKK
ncbi:MAG: DUF3078 domain-containing protein, partial [Bacteroidales bacterium]